MFPLIDEGCQIDRRRGIDTIDDQLGPGPIDAISINPTWIYSGSGCRHLVGPDSLEFFLNVKRIWSVAYSPTAAVASLT
jgi:hypothetical protein